MAETILCILPSTALGRAVLTGAAENKVSLHLGREAAGDRKVHGQVKLAALQRLLSCWD